jgi:hypothetical protein
MALDGGKLRERIETVLRRYVQPGLKSRVSLRAEQTEQEKLAEMAELAAMVATSVAAGGAVWPEPAFGFAQASEWTFGQGTFAAEPWVPEESAHTFRKVGRTKTQEELERLAKAWKEVISAFDGLHKPAIDALQSKIGGTAAHERAEAGAKLEKVESALADLNHIPEMQGPQPHKQAEQKLMAALAETYFNLTGELPAPRAKKRGSFHAFVHEIFEAMGIEKPSDDMVRVAANDLKNSAKKSPK